MAAPKPRKLTQGYVDDLRPRDEPFEVREKGDPPAVPGLILRCQRSGRKLFYAGYRRPVRDDKTGKWKNKQTRTCLGRADHLSLDDARKQARVALSAATLAVNKRLKGDRVKDHVTKALLNLDQSVDEIEAAAEKQDNCPTVEQFIDKIHGPSLETSKKYAKGGRETARLKFLLKLYESEPGLDLLNLKINSVDFGKIDDWRIKRSGTVSQKTGKTLSSTTIQRDLAQISGLFRTAIKRKLITTNPVAEIDHKTIDNQIVRYLGSNDDDPDEEARFLKALEDRDEQKKTRRKSGNKWASERGNNTRSEIRGDRYADYLRPLVMLALNTGLRRGELLTLKWKFVKLRKNKSEENTSFIRIPGRLTKNGKPNDVPLNDFITRVLRKWRNQCATIDQDAYVFPGRNGNKLYDVRKSWIVFLRAAKIKDFRFHDLRHHFASQLVMNGEPLNTVRELLNHRDLQMTLRYTHLAPDHKRDTVNRLSQDSKKWKV